MALLGALAAHAAVFLSFAPGAMVSSQTASDVLGAVDVELEPAPTERAAAERATPPEAEREPAMRSSGFAARPPSDVRNAEPILLSEAPLAASSGAPMGLTRPTRLSLAQLGLAGRNMFLGASSDKVGAAPEPAPEHNEAPGVELSMRDAQLEHDHAAGLDGSGAVIGAAEEVARANDAPLNSKAMFELTVDPHGDVTSVHLMAATAAEGAWERIGASLVSSLRARRPVLRHGTAMVVTLEITSRWQLPSGDNPGSPVGSDRGGLSFDVTDIGARPLRVVHARIVKEKAQR